MTSSTVNCQAGPLSNARNSRLETRSSNSIARMLYNVFGLFTGILGLRMILCLHQSNTIPVRTIAAASIMRCTQVIGGGQYRYVIYNHSDLTTNTSCRSHWSVGGQGPQLYH